MGPTDFRFFCIDCCQYVYMFLSPSKDQLQESSHQALEPGGASADFKDVVAVVPVAQKTFL
jgi:hypothetical protein